MSIVTFCGHRRIPKADFEIVRQALYREVELLIKNGAVEFLLGGYGDFDSMAAHVVRSLKKMYPYIKSTLVLAYINKEFNKELYDSSVFPPLENTPKKFAILKRNQWMVENSDILVAFVNCDWGGANTMLEYAKRKKIIILNIANTKTRS